MAAMLKDEVFTTEKKPYKIPWKGIPWPYDPDMIVPVPLHCLQRMFDAIGYTEICRPGTCLERDLLIAEQCIIDTMKKEKKK